MVALYCLLNLRFTYWFIKDVLPTLEDGVHAKARARRQRGGGFGGSSRVRRGSATPHARFAREKAKPKPTFTPSASFFRVDRILQSSLRDVEAGTDRVRLGGGGRCRTTSARVAAASKRVAGACAPPVAPAAPDTPPRSRRSTPPSRRKLLHRCYSLHGVVWRRVEISRREGCRAPNGFASHVPGVAQDDHLQQGALTGRHGARELSMRGANEGVARALERRRLLAELAGGPIDCSFPPSPRLSSRRRRVKKCRSYLSYSLATRAPHPTRLRRTPRVALRSRTRR